MTAVTNESELRSAITAAESEIYIANDIEINSPLNINYQSTWTCAQGASLIWANPAATARDMIIAAQTANLTINGLILDARSKDGTLIFIDGGNVALNNCTLKGVTSTTAQNAVQLGQLNSTQSGGFLTLTNSTVTQINAADAIIGYSANITLDNSKITQNNATGITLLASDSLLRSTLTMKNNSTVSFNTRTYAPGGVVLFSTDMIMGAGEGDACSVSNNSSTDYAYGGIYLTEASNLTMRYNSTVDNNYGTGHCGGIGANNGSTITLENNATVKNNKSDADAGGISLNQSTLIMKDNAQISGNTCLNLGKGVFIANNSTIKLSDSISILDGLYFNEPPQPIIESPLTQNAKIVLEPSNYVSPSNVPVLIAVKGDSCPDLAEYDKAAWIIPPSFGAGHITILNEGLTQVLITRQTYSINYENLKGSTHQNPLTYDVSDLPITLTDPSLCQDYCFKGWQDESGNLITQIDESFARDITLNATWERLCVVFKADHACNVPHPIFSKGGKIKIPEAVPTKCCQTFICWNTPSSGSGKTFFPLDTVFLSTSSLTLTAQFI